MLVAIAPWRASSNPAALVITGARVLDPVAGRYVQVAAVVIEGDRIAAVHVKPGAPLPADVERRDLAGATLVPGLVDFHARAAPAGPLEADFFAAMSLAHGVTAVRAIGTHQPWLLAQRARIHTGDVMAPRLWLTGQPLGERLISGALAATRNPDVLALTRADVSRIVSQQQQAAVDWIKVFATAGPDVMRAIASAARDARLKVSVEAVRVPIAQAAELGIDALDGVGLPVRSIDVLSAPAGADSSQILDLAWTQVTDSDIAAAVFAMRRRNVALVPLLGADAARALTADTPKDPQLERLPAALRSALEVEARQRSAAEGATARRAHERRLALVGAFAKQDGRILTGSGTGERGYPVPGAAVHAELSRLVSAGLTPIEAIRAATSSAADALGAAKSLGQIRAGYRADLFAVSGDPLQRVEDLARIVFILRGGEVLDREALLKQATRATGIVK